ncbi:MAG: Arc family DNA-binding protein [Sulfuricella sp.]|nr:Arc family DNA-binding protein [Sulfuricella sp.]
MTGIRMPPELKEKIQREAQINGRSLNLEIVDRLKRSPERRSTEGANRYVTEQSVKPNDYTPEFTDLERQLLSIFRRLPVEKQLALISLFK